MLISHVNDALGGVAKKVKSKNDYSGAMIRGNVRMFPSDRHPAKVLYACGWRTEAQLKKARDRKDNRTYNAWLKLESQRNS